MKAIHLLFTGPAGEAQLSLGQVAAMVAAQKVVPLEQIATATLCPNIHMDDKTDKDEPKEKVGRQDVPLVVIVQAPC